MNMRSILNFALAAALVIAVSFTGNLLTIPKLAGWYAQLVKPPLTPPNYVFPLVWNTLFALMTISLWRLLEAQSSPLRSRAIALFIAQLALNVAWSFAFFHLEAIKGAVAVIAVFAVLIAATIYAASKVSRFAAWLLVPYLAWVLFATLLNVQFALMNP